MEYSSDKKEFPTRRRISLRPFYHPPRRAARAAEGLADWIDGFEFHYPNELNEDNLDDVRKALGSKDIYCLALGLFSFPEFALGSFINPRTERRREAVAITKRGIDLAAEIGAKFIIWPGGEGYNYPFQANYNEVWSYFIDGIGMVGASFFTETIALARELQKAGYGGRGERIGYDLFPYTENQVEVVKQSIIDEALSAAERERDAVKAYAEVYRAMGIDASFLTG